MTEFFSFMFQVVLVFIIFWWFGVNFFKHRHEISSWFEKRRLDKLAALHSDKVIDVREVFKKEFGFVGTAEYVKKRMEEIRESLISKESEFVSLTALEFIFLIEELETQVLKTEKGTYIVSMKNIRTLLMEDEKDLLYFAKKFTSMH